MEIERSKKVREIPEVTLAGHSDGFSREVRERAPLRMVPSLSDRYRSILQRQRTLKENQSCRIVDLLCTRYSQVPHRYPRTRAKIHGWIYRSIDTSELEESLAYR